VRQCGLEPISVVRASYSRVLHIAVVHIVGLLRLFTKNCNY